MCHGRERCGYEGPAPARKLMLLRSGVRRRGGGRVRPWADFASPFATPTRIGNHEAPEAEEALVEEELKLMWLR